MTFTNYEHGPGCTLGVDGKPCATCAQQYGGRPAVVGPRCRVCGEPRPVGYSNTCGRSECQEQDVKENRLRNQLKRRAR